MFFWVACCKLKFATANVTVHIGLNVVLIIFLATVFVSCRISSTKQISHLVAGIPTNHKVLDRQRTRVSARMRRNERQKTNERSTDRDTKIWKWNGAGERFQSRWLPVHVNAVGFRQNSNRIPSISRGQKCRDRPRAVSTNDHRDAARLITTADL